MVFDAGNDEASAVIRKRAEEKQAPCYPVRPQQLKIKKITRKNIDFSFASRYDDVIPIEIPFVAEYQVMNMALAYQALMLLGAAFFACAGEDPFGASHSPLGGQNAAGVPGGIF